MRGVCLKTLVHPIYRCRVSGFRMFQCWHVVDGSDPLIGFLGASKQPLGLMKDRCNQSRATT